MSVSASCQSVFQETTVSSLLAGRVAKRPRVDDGQQLQEAAVQLLLQQQNLGGLFREVENLRERGSSLCFQSGEQRPSVPQGSSSSSTAAGSLLVCELRSQAAQLGVPVAMLTVKTTLERLTKLLAAAGAEDERRRLLTSNQRAQLCVLLESSRELMFQGVLCPKLLWQEYRREQQQPSLELLYHLHIHNLLTVTHVLHSDDAVRQWLASQMKTLCSWIPPQAEDETKRVRHKLLSTFLAILIGSGFEPGGEPAAAAAAEKRASRLCCSVLDDMLFWLLDSVEHKTARQGPDQWIRMFDSSLCGASASAEALQRFFTHCLTQTFTYKPRLTVSDAVSLQKEWTFVKADQTLTSLFRKLSLVFSSTLLLRHLQQVLETHEVNWKHALCFLSTLLVYNPGAQSDLRELLSTLLTSAFDGYDLEHMITAFLLARQGALEGTAVFPSYTDWFKMSFGGSSGFHAASKKSLVFLLKFLSDLVPFEPPQYLKVHVLHPPFVPPKHRSLLMEYISLAKTRLNDLKESLEEMGLYEDVSTAGRASAQPQCQAVQDVEKAVSLFETTGRISATVMEASIFRRPYFLTRFLPALLTPRVLPVKADPRMNLIEALKKADKVPAAQYSSYVESCQKQRRQDKSVVCVDVGDDPVEVLKVQLQEFRELLANGDDGEMMAQLSRISHTISVVFPGHSSGVLTEQTVITVHLDSPLCPQLHVTVINMIIRSFCQYVLDATRTNPPNKQNLWASRFVSMLLSNKQLLSGLVHRLWHLFHTQGSSLSSSHLLGLAAFVVHLHASASHNPLVQLAPLLPTPVCVGEALGSALVCGTRADMFLCVRLCVAVACYGICREDSESPQQQDYIISSFYKKLLYLVPRLMPEARRMTPVPAETPAGESWEETQSELWDTSADSGSSWRTTAWRLWTNAAFQQRLNSTQCQLSVREWVSHELRVQRSEDALTDLERQEYQQWACMEFYLPRPEEQGGCGGDTKNLCSCLLNTIMEQPMSSDLILEKLHHRGSIRGSCLPDIMSRLQELVCEMEVTNICSRWSSRGDVCDFLFEFVSQRASSTSSSELGLQHTLHTFNRILLALPPLLFINIKAEGGGKTLDCTKLIQHINQHQRMACCPVGSMSFHLTAHFLRGLLSASVCCERPREEVNKAWRQITDHCPLLLTSTVMWWQRLSPLLLSLWRRVCDADSLPEELQLITDCHCWANGVVSGSSPAVMPAAPALLLASGLHGICPGEKKQSYSAALRLLRTERGDRHRQVLVFLFFLCVQENLSALLYSQEKTVEKLQRYSAELLSALVDSADWLLIFKPSEQGVYESVGLMMSDEFIRLMPWVFYRLLLQQNTELQEKALRCPGFLQTSVLCYVGLLQLFLDGDKAAADPADEGRILSRAKWFLLRVISQTPPAALSSAQRRRLESQCSDLDPEVAAALSAHLNPPDLSPEMEFL